MKLSCSEYGPRSTQSGEQESVCEIVVRVCVCGEGAAVSLCVGKQVRKPVQVHSGGCVYETVAHSQLSAAKCVR